VPCPAATGTDVCVGGEKGERRPNGCRATWPCDKGEDGMSRLIRSNCTIDEALSARAVNYMVPQPSVRQKSLDSERTRTTILPTLPPAVGATISRWALGASSRANVAPTTGVSSPRSMLA
jgi:hypothetical protein